MAKSRFGPAALAALLLEAPQCVPYAQRVEVFRSLIVGLKATCASHCDLGLLQSSRLCELALSLNGNGTPVCPWRWLMKAIAALSVLPLLSLVRYPCKCPQYSGCARRSAAVSLPVAVWPAG